MSVKQAKCQVEDQRQGKRECEMQNAKCELPNAKCEMQMQNAKCMRNAKRKTAHLHLERIPQRHDRLVVHVQTESHVLAFLVPDEQWIDTAQW